MRRLLYCVQYSIVQLVLPRTLHRCGVQLRAARALRTCGCSYTAAANLDLCIDIWYPCGVKIRIFLVFLYICLLPCSVRVKPHLKIRQHRRCRHRRQKPVRRIRRCSRRQSELRNKLHSYFQTLCIPLKHKPIA